MPYTVGADAKGPGIVHACPVASGVLPGHGSNESLRSFLQQAARFVRVYINGITNNAQTSLQEVAIHGSMTTGMKYNVRLTVDKLSIMSCTNQCK